MKLSAVLVSGLVFFGLDAMTNLPSLALLIISSFIFIAFWLFSSELKSEQKLVAVALADHDHTPEKFVPIGAVNPNFGKVDMFDFI